MSGMVTMQARKLRTCQLGMSCWSVGRWPTSAGKSHFTGSIVTSVKRLPICAKNSWVLTLMGPSVSSATGKKVVGAAEWAVLVLFSDSCSLSGTGTGNGTLLQISVSQSVDHCDVLSGAASRVPWQQCQTVRPLAVVTDQPVWFLHPRNAGSSQSAPYDSNAVGILYGCRPSSSVVFCNGCIVAKRCKIGPR